MKYQAKDVLQVMKHAKNYNNFLIRTICKTIKKYNCINVLDFGCADGFFMENINSATDKINFNGVDLDETSISICNQKGFKTECNINNFENKYDLIYSLNTLEHIEKDEKCLQEIQNKLKKDARLILYVPALNCLYSSMDKRAGHIRRYTKKELKEKVSKYFEIEKIEYCDFLGVFAAFLYVLKDKILKNNHGKVKKFQIIAYDFIFPISRLLDKIVFKKIIGKNLLVYAKKI